MTDSNTEIGSGDASSEAESKFFNCLIHHIETLNSSSRKTAR